MSDLLTCPFCGGNNIDPAFARGYRHGETSLPTLAAGCFDCSATGPEILIPWGHDGIAESTAAWNIRATKG